MPATKTKKLSGPQQIKMLGALNQQSAAWVVGVEPRTLRDKGAPRNEDGTYDARELLAWSSTASSTTELDDSVMERCLNVAEFLECEIHTDTALAAIVDLLRELRSTGSEHLLAFSAVLLVVLAERRDRLPKTITEPMHPRGVMDTEARKLAYESMRVATTCPTCGKLRRGTTWLKADVPRGHFQFVGECPACEDKSNGNGKS